MKKALKIIGIVVLSVLVLCVSGKVMLEHGWRLWGFSKCESPDALFGESVFVGADVVRVSGTTNSSALRYNGYTYKRVGDTLYIGVRYDIFGTYWADFSVEIKDDFSNLKKVVLTNGEKEEIIWDSAHS